MALLVKAGGGENVTPQVETYETLLETAIANLAGKAFKPTQSKTVTPTAAGLTVTPDEGQSLGEVIINGDADLIAENIRQGIDIFGVLGAMSEGVSGIDYGTVTLTSDQINVTINHNLKKKPSWVALIPKDADTREPEDTYGYVYAKFNKRGIYSNSGYFAYDITENTLTETQVVFRHQDYFGGYQDKKFAKGSYYWIVIA